MQEGKSLLHTILLSKKQTRLTQEVKMNIELIIDPEFVACIPPLSQDEFEQLEENILSSGKIYNPILVWNHTIVDGHNRYRILKRHPEIEAKIESIAFDSRYDAIAFICENQVSRRELNEVQRAYIIGKRYDADMQSHKAVASRQTRIDGRFHRCSQNENNGERTRECIARKYGVSPTKVSRNLDFSKGVDAAENAFPGIREKILSKHITPPMQEVAQIARLPTQERYRASKRLLVLTNARGKSKARKSGLSQFEIEITDPQITVEKYSTPTVDENSILETMQGEAENFIDTVDNLFVHFPKLLEDEEFQRRTKAILKQVKDYIIEKTGE